MTSSTYHGDIPFEQKRIMLVVRRLKIGGIEKATMNLADGLLRAGHEVHLLLLKGESQLPLPQGLQLHRYDLDKKARRYPLGLLVDMVGRFLLRYLMPGSGFIWRGWQVSREMHRFLSMIESKHGAFDLILLRGTGVYEVLWNFRHPKCWQVSESPPTGFVRYRNAGLYYRMLYQGKKVVTVSAGLGEVLTDILADHDVHVARQTVIHNAMPIEEIRALARVTVADLPHEPYLLHVARLSPVKNQSLLLKAYAASSLALPLVIVGEGSEEARLRNLAARLRIADRVLFLGPKSNPYPYMAHASAVVLSSNQEGLGLVLIEALACGTQVVATDVPGGIREVMIDELQRLIAHNSVEGLAGKLREAVGRPVDVRPEWADRFDLAHIVPQFVNLALDGVHDNLSS